MKVSISYPPLESSKGVACLSQNRQFQWFNHPTYIYPVVPAYAATLLESKGYEVMWDDAISQELSYEQWKDRIIKEKPDVVAIETKTPVVKMHWEIINDLKREFSKFKIQNTKFVLMGDHVSALPEESLKNSSVDFVLAHGDYDFGLLNLAEYLTKNAPLSGGFWWRDERGEIRNSGPADISRHDLSDLPLIDRELTRWKDYGYKNGNFKYKPGAYIMSGRDCWWGKCAFCSWASLFPGEKFRCVSPEKALDEIGNLIDLGAREVMEDSGTLPIGEWLKEFCRGMVERGYSKKISISCNMRINAIKDPKMWEMMKEAGFRLILFGLESANQETLDRINKNLKVEEIEPSLKKCKEAGLEPHITAMVGYPWETEEMALKTVDLAKKLFKKGIIDTLQGTIVIPYPGTPLYSYCVQNNLLLTRDYSRFDQREMIMKAPISSREAKKIVQKLYSSFISPRFIVKKITSIRTFDDLKFIFAAGWKWLGKMSDFKSAD